MMKKLSRKAMSVSAGISLALAGTIVAASPAAAVSCGGNETVAVWSIGRSGSGGFIRHEGTINGNRVGMQWDNATVSQQRVGETMATNVDNPQVSVTAGGAISSWGTRCTVR